MRRIVVMFFVALSVMIFGGSTIVTADETNNDYPFVKAHRLYQPQTGEHRYVANIYLLGEFIENGWQMENGGLLFTINQEKYLPRQHLYTLYNLTTNDVLYTSNETEVQYLTTRGNVWQIYYPSDLPMRILDCDCGIPVYRLYNSNSVNGRHHFTAIVGEIDLLIQAGWRYEGIAFYASGVE